MNHVERIDRKLAYKGAIIDIFADTMRLPDGKIETWDQVHHRRGAACVVPVLPDGRILLIKQYRPALDRIAIELPAGARDSLEEDTIICAKRELLEETGYESKEWSLLVKLRPTIAYCDEFIDIYLAKDITKVGEQQLDEAEAIEMQPYTIEEIKKMIFETYEIQDGKTMAGILAYFNKENK